MTDDNSNIQRTSRLRFCFFFFLKILVVVCIFGIAGISLLKQDDVNKNLELVEFCNSANLDVLVYPDNKMNTITVSFELTDSKFEDCFTYFCISLESEYKTVDEYTIQSKEKTISYKFENVKCGTYEVLIKPCYNDWQCALMGIRYDKLINMSSSDCVNKFPDKKFLPVKNIEKKIVTSLIVISVILMITVSGWIYYYYWSDKARKEKIHQIREEPEQCEVATRSPDVYILHYYDKNGEVKKRVKVLKASFPRSSCFASVRDIEEELAFILYDVNGWLDSMLEKENTDGSTKKIILIDTKDYEDEDYELENLIYTKFIEKLRNIPRCFTDYNNLFVVRLDGITTYSEKLRSIVSRDRFYIPRDLNDLCLNLCSDPELGVSVV